MKVSDFLGKWRKDYEFRTVISSAISTIINAGYIIMNGAMGIIYGSIWNGSICVYYIFLTFVRGYIIAATKGIYILNDETSIAKKRRKVYFQTHIALIFMNIALIVPIRTMIIGSRDYTHGLIPAIALAAYTTYRIVMSSIQLRKVRKNSNILIKEIRSINMIDSLLSLLTLQNALIITCGGMNENMRILTIVSSSVIFIEIMFITINSFMKLKNTNSK